VATNSGENFLLGNSENTTPDGGATVDISHYRAAAEPLGEVERDRFYRRQALDWMAENPGAALSLYLRKVLNYFNYRNVLVTDSESSRLRELVLMVSYWPVLLLGIGRLLYDRWVPLNRIELLLSGLYFSNALVSALFFTRIRFRIPFDFLLIALAASFVGRLIEAWRRAQSDDAPTAVGGQLPSSGTDPSSASEHQGSPGLSS
jgi:hypothetical protein